jgi:hypothetical protein
MAFPFSMKQQHSKNKKQKQNISIKNSIKIMRQPFFFQRNTYITPLFPEQEQGSRHFSVKFEVVEFSN